jgi:hypothetical protein
MTGFSSVPSTHEPALKDDLRAMIKLYRPIKGIAVLIARHKEIFPLVSTSFLLGRENVYRYAHFFFFWLTSSYVEDSNKMTASCMFCVLQRGSWVRMGCSGSDVQSSHPPHITTHHIHEY